MSAPSLYFDYMGHLKYLGQRFTQPASVYDFALLCNLFLLACVNRPHWNTDEEVQAVEVLHNCITGFSTHVEKTVVSLWNVLWPHDATAEYAYALIHKLLNIAVERIAPSQDQALKLRLQFLVWSICNSENPALPSLFHFSTLDELVGTAAVSGAAQSCLVQPQNVGGREVAEAHEGGLTAPEDAVPSTACPVESIDAAMADAKMLANPRDDDEGMPAAKRIKLEPTMCASPESILNLSPLSSPPTSPHEDDRRAELQEPPSTPPPRHAKPTSPFFRSPGSTASSRDSTPSPSRTASPHRSPSRLVNHNLPRTQRKQLRRTSRGTRHAARTIITRSQVCDKENIASVQAA